MIFVAEDNGYAETTASSWSVSGSQVGRGEGFGMPSREVNGADFFEVYEAAGEMIERAREGGGPSLLHVRLNRFYGHFEGDAMTYRAADEVVNARQNADPLKLFRQRVVEASLLSPDELDAIDRTSRDDIARTMVEAKAAPLPTEADLMTDVYFRY
jgi:pyruvate dehydrogenase E1 component alpha subunit